MEASLGDLKQRLQHAIDLQQSRLEELQALREECVVRQQELDELPSKPTVLMPLSEAALFHPGDLAIHATGDGRHIECTHARSILARRREAADADIACLRNDIAKAREQHSVFDLLLQAQGEAGLSEIRQTVEESNDLLQQAGPSRPQGNSQARQEDEGEFERLMQRMEELELLEEEAERQQERQAQEQAGAGSAAGAAAAAAEEVDEDEDGDGSQEASSEDDGGEDAAADFDSIISGCFEAPSLEDLLALPHRQAPVEPIGSSRSAAAAAAPSAPAPAPAPAAAAAAAAGLPDTSCKARPAKRVSWSNDIEDGTQKAVGPPAKPGSGLRRGFFLSSSAGSRRASGAEAAAAAAPQLQQQEAVASSSGSGGSLAVAEGRLEAARRAAFTGQVLEHAAEEAGAPELPIPAAAAPIERPKRVSRFKMQRMGLVD
jgi:hypothetical protein